MQICPRTWVHDCRSKSASLKHYALSSHYTSLKLFGNINLTCLTHMSVVRIWCFSSWKSNNLGLKTCRISLVPRPISILPRYVVDSPLITSSADSRQIVQTNKGWREDLGTGWLDPRTYLPDPNTTSENLEFFVLEWKLEQCCSQG